MSRSVPPRALGSFVSLGVLVLFAACRDAGPGSIPDMDTGALVSGGAELRVTEDSAPRWGDASEWTVAATPTLDLADPAAPFQGVAPVLRLSDGRIVVADGARQDIRYYDPAGKLLLSVGGRGPEPGQFHALGWIGHGAADTVVAYDFVARRFALFDPRAKFVRTVPLVAGDSTSFAEPLASYPDGAVLMRLGGAPNPFPGAPGTFLRDSATYLRVPLNGARPVSLGIFPQSQLFGVTVRPNTPPAPFPVPFGLATAATLRGDTLLLGTGQRFEVASIGPDGAPLAILRAAIERAPITSTDAKRYTSAALTRLRTGALSLKTQLDSGFMRAIEHAPFPKRKPAFGRLLVDATGALWVSAPLDPPGEATAWNVFAPDGAWLGAVTTPEGLRVDEIGVDYLLGVARPPIGPERVQSYRLTRGGS